MNIFNGRKYLKWEGIDTQDIYSNNQTEHHVCVLFSFMGMRLSLKSKKNGYKKWYLKELEELFKLSMFITCAQNKEWNHLEKSINEKNVLEKYPAQYCYYDGKFVGTAESLEWILFYRYKNSDLYDYFKFVTTFNCNPSHIDFVYFQQVTSKLKQNLYSRVDRVIEEIKESSNNNVYVAIMYHKYLELTK